MNDVLAPTTDRGRADHALSWSDDPEEYHLAVGDHSNDPAKCDACLKIADIENEARASMRGVETAARKVLEEWAAIPDLAYTGQGQFDSAMSGLRAALRDEDGA